MDCGVAYFTNWNIEVIKLQLMISQQRPRFKNAEFFSYNRHVLRLPPAPKMESRAVGGSYFETLERRGYRVLGAFDLYTVMDEEKSNDGEFDTGNSENIRTEGESSDNALEPALSDSEMSTYSSACIDIPLSRVDTFEFFLLQLKSVNKCN